MSKLNEDLLYLIFENFKDDKKTVQHSCLLVNKTWCKIIVPILWNDPWSNLKEKQEESLLKVIISHIPDEMKIKEIYNYLEKSQRHLLDSELYQRPLFNYISFCKHLNLDSIMKMTNIINESSERLIIQEEIFKLFINKNIEITHLYIPKQFSYQIQLIPDFKNCFEKVKFLSCSTNIDNNILIGLTEVCKLIKELRLYIEPSNNNYEIARLIKPQKKLVNIDFEFYYGCCFPQDEPLCEILENSLIKHASTIEYFRILRPFATGILSSLVNLKELTFSGDCSPEFEWDYLENLSLSLPHLQYLDVNLISINYLTNIIESTRGSLIEIKICDYIGCHVNYECERIIQVIYKNCPELKYLEFMIEVDENILEVKKLLNNCQYLNELHIDVKYEINWDYLFNTLIESSPICLFKFFFKNHRPIKLESLISFLDNWKGARPSRPMLLQLYRMDVGIRNLIEEYEKEGIVVYFNGC